MQGCVGPVRCDGSRETRLDPLEPDVLIDTCIGIVKKNTSSTMNR